MLETLIGAVLEAVFGYLLGQGNLGEKVQSLLKREPQQVAFKVAFTYTYAAFNERHPQWTSSLFDEHFLTHHAAPLLARALLRDAPPTSTELAQVWADQFETSTESHAQAVAKVAPIAADFLTIYEQELRARSEFRPLFDSRALDTTADATTQTAQSTAELVTLLQALLERFDPQPSLYPNPSPPVDPPISPGSNPFISGTPVPPDQFYGRIVEREHIKNRLGGRVAECVSIIGMRRSGKSSLLRYIRERTYEFCVHDQLVMVSLDLQDARLRTPHGINEGLRRGIKHATGSTPWQCSENDDLWAIHEGLEALRDNGHRLLILIDEFECIGTRLDQFVGWGEDWRSKVSAELMTLVIATLRPLDEIYQQCGLTSPFGNLFSSVTLGALEQAAWHKLMHDGFAASAADMQCIDELAGGMAFYTQMAAALLWQHGDHAHTRAAFVKLAEPRFNELWRDMHDNERRALRHAAGVPGVPAPAAALRERLHDYGLLRADGRLFSSAFAEFVKEQ